MADFGDFTAAGKELNTSIPLGAKPPPPIGFAAAGNNPFETAYRLASTQNALNANTQFQMRLMAQKALGPIYAQNIDPSSGELNTEGVLSAAAKDPRIAPMLPSIATDLLSQRHQILQNQSQKIANESAKTQFGLSALGSVLDSGKEVSDENLQRALGLPNSPLSVAEQAKWLTSLPVNPQERREALQQLKVQMLSAQERLAAAHKDLPQMMTGSNILQFQQDQLKPGSPTSLVGSARMGLTPPEQIALHTVTGAQGDQTQVSGAQLGQAILGSPTGNGGPPPSANMPAGTTGADLLRGTGGGAAPPQGGNPLNASPPGGSTNLRALAPGGAGVTTMNPREAEAQKAFGAQEQETAQQVIQLRPIASAMQLERQAVRETQLGGWDNAREHLARNLQGLANAARDAGVPLPDKMQSVIDQVAGGKLHSLQEFQAAIQPLIMGAYKQGVQGTGRGFMLEYKNALDHYPGIETDPAQYENVSNMFARGFQQMLDQQQGMMQFRQEHEGQVPQQRFVGAKSYADFNPLFTNELVKKGQMAFPQETGYAKGSKNEVSPGSRPRRVNADNSKPLEVDGKRWYRIGGHYYPEEATVE